MRIQSPKNKGSKESERHSYFNKQTSIVEQIGLPKQQMTHSNEYYELYLEAIG